MSKKKKWVLGIVILVIAGFVPIVDLFLKYQYFQQTKNEILPVNKDAKYCKVASDCVFVETSCSSCCEFEVINRKERDNYKENFARNCKGYEGPICDCFVGKYIMYCVSGQCAPVFCGYDSKNPECKFAYEYN